MSSDHSKTINSRAWNKYPDVPIQQRDISRSIKDTFIVAKSIFFSGFGICGRNNFLAIITLL